MEKTNKEKIVSLEDLLKYIKTTIKKREFKYIAFFWIIISIQFIIGSSLQYDGYSIKSPLDFIMKLIAIILLSIIFIMIHYCCIEIIKIVKQYNEGKKLQHKNEKSEENHVKVWDKLKKYRALIYFCIIILCWVPILLAYYPAIVSYDGGWQIGNYVFNNGKMSHHPVLITLIYASFYKLGLLYGDANWGMFWFSIFQMTFMASMFSYVITFVEDRTQNKIVTIISLLFYAVFPYNQLMSIITTKDVIFAGMFLLFLINFYKAFEKKLKLKDYIFLVITGTIMLLTRNNTVIILAASIPFIFCILFKDKENLKKAMIILLLTIILYKIVSVCIYANTNSTNDEGSPRLFPFAQATAKIVGESEDELTEDEKEKISYYFTNYEKLAKDYKPAIADNTANLINSKNINKDKKEFYIFMWQLFRKYPVKFIDSGLNTIRGLWYINDTSFNTINHDKMKHIAGALELFTNPIKLDPKYKLSIQSKIPKLRSFYNKMFCLNEYENIPILYILFQPATYFYISLAFLLYVMYKKDNTKKTIGIIIFLYAISNIVGACALVRYLYPVIVCTPLMLALSTKNKKNHINCLDRSVIRMYNKKACK